MGLPHVSVAVGGKGERGVPQTSCHLYIVQVGTASVALHMGLGRRCAPLLAVHGLLCIIAPFWWD